MARCPDCNKFVSYDLPHTVEEKQGPEVDGENVTASVRLVLNCGECYTELKEANLDLEAEVKHECSVLDPEDEETGPDYELVDDDNLSNEWEATDRTEGKGRGQRTFYGASLTTKVKCVHCEEEVEVELADDVQASNFEDV